MNLHRSTAFSTRQFAEQALSRSAGAPLIGGNAVDLLIDAQAHFDAWLDAIGKAQRHVFLENYIVRNDRIGQAFLAALVEKARSGVFVAVIADWAGCLGQSRSSFWDPLRKAGGEVRIYNPPRLGSSFGWISRDHRKVLVVDGEVGFLSGVCISEKWLGEPARDVPPWRDTGVRLRGPAVTEIERAFTDSWRDAGPAGLPDDPRIVHPAHEGNLAGDVDLRVIATQPSTAGMYRLDQMVAAMATKTLWLTDAYFVGVAPYVQALSAASRDGVDVRLLVPGTSDIPMVAGMSRSGYRPLLKAGIRVFEWNGSMLHAKTAVADGKWARVGSSNLNIASWLSNREIDVAIENAAFAQQLADQYEEDLENATEILLRGSRRRSGNERMRSRTPRPPRPKRGGGSSSRAAAGALRIANTVGAAITHHRVLGDTESGPVLAGAVAAIVLTVVAVLWPAVIAWPLALIGAWFAVNLTVNWFALRRHRRKNAADDVAP
jgi:cardiolipin synthase A/B